MAEYLVSRNLIIGLLEKKIKSNILNEYEKEKVIHDIFFPRKTTTDQLSLDNVNLWLIDDQLIFHEFAASDKPLKDFSSSNSDLRPDIIIFSEGDKSQNLDEVSIFELKRPMLKSFPKDPISYLYNVIQELKDKKIECEGRTLLCNGNTRFYCYVLCDVTKDIDTLIRDHRMTELNQNLGYWTFHPDLKAHVWITSFNDLIKIAKRRNAVFLSKLNITP